MYKFDAAAYHQAVVVLTQAIWICMKAGPDIEFKPLGEKPSANMVENLDALLSVLEPLNVPVTKIAVSEFEEKLRGQQDADYPVNFHNATKSLTDISQTLRRELKATSVFVLDSSKAFYYEPALPLFGHAVSAKFPTLAYDITEAGKCLALDRSTAAAFHSIRSLEGGIAAMSRCLGIPDATKGADRNWGAMLTKIKGEIDKRWTGGAARFSGNGTYLGLPA